MDSLRIALIIIGIVLVAGIYLFGRNRRNRLDPPLRHDLDPDEFPDVLMERHDQPPLQDDDAMWEEAFQDDAPPAVPRQRAKAPVPPPAEPLTTRQPAPPPAPVVDEDDEVVVPAQDVLVLTLMAPEGEPYQGKAILAMAKQLTLHHSSQGIFHYFPSLEGVGDEPWFGIANAVEPGVFDLDAIDQLTTPGLALFLQLPGPERGERMLRHMLETGHQMSEQIGGRLCDHQRRPLTREQAEAMMQRAAQFQSLPVV